MTKYCRMCGQANMDDARFCTKCGTPFVEAVDQQAQPTTAVQQPQAPQQTQPTQQASTTPPPQPPPPGGYTQTQPQPYGAVDAHYYDVRGLSKIRLYSIVGIVGFVLGVIVYFVSLGAYFSLLLSYLSSPSSAASPPPELLGFGVALTTVLDIVSVALGIAAFVLLYQGFSSISVVDRSLRTPTRLLLAIPVGIIVLAAGFAFIIGEFLSGLTPGLGALYIFIALIIVALALLLAGGIGGEILGLYRVGSRYRETIIQVGAILLIIPFVSLVSPILIFIGSSSALSRIRQQVTAPTA